MFTKTTSFCDKDMSECTAKQFALFQDISVLMIIRMTNQAKNKNPKDIEKEKIERKTKGLLLLGNLIVKCGTSLLLACCYKTTESF